jgi:methionine biosynthesis protein MetW
MVDIGQSIKKKETRKDFEIISKLIKQDSKVIDIGCGDGELLEFLKNACGAKVRGIEINDHNVSKALIRKIPVVQGDAENDLLYYPNNSFDYAILSHTIQATRNPANVLREMMRISSCAIVSLPNFAHYQNRLHLLLRGTMPVSEVIPYEWYETPNIHFCSVRDFENFCHELGFEIVRKVFLTNTLNLNELIPSEVILGAISNLFAEYGIFVLQKFEPVAAMEPISSRVTKSYSKVLSPQ